MAAVTHTFNAAGNGAAHNSLYGDFNYELKGDFVATMQLQRTTDSGVTWVPVSDDVGNYNSFNKPVSSVAREPEAGTHVQWRWACTNYVSGTVQARLSQ